MDMSGRISDDIIEEIRASSDIVDLISEYVPLKKQGKNFVGLCPFHQEKKPSFSVSPQRQIFHCFGCGIGGNVFKFLMEYQKLGFIDAVKYLAERAHITLPATGRELRSGSEFEPLYKANHLAAAHYHQQLVESTEGEKARQYLHQRGFSEGLIKTFRLGYAPPGWDGLIKRAERHSILPEVLYQAGLVLKKDYGEGYYDRFRDRLIFPITNVSGKFIGFGGRILEDRDEVKYINSPETPIFRKGTTLYGLYQTKEAIRKAGGVVIVEGYTDLLGLFQSGIENAVASLGTSLTTQQARLLSRYAHEAIVLYDGDSAGITAALRGLDLLLEAGVLAKALALSPGMDPDQVVREKGGPFLAGLLQDAETFIDFKLRYLRQKENFASVTGKAEAVEELGRTISLIDDPIKRGFYVAEVAEKLGLEDSIIALAVEKASPRRGDKPRIEAKIEDVMSHFELVERKLLALLLQHPDMISRVRGRVSDHDFIAENHRRVADRLFASDQTGSIEPAKLMNSLSDEGLESLIAELCFEEEEGKVERVLEDHVRYLEGKRLLREERRLREQLREAEKSDDNTLLNQLTRRLQEIAQKRFQSTSSSP